ncbi:MAG: Manganese transport system membrane protein MntD [Chlamydiia bacterium]|nr:Manganese transport system membrane protein MntD [Chlamydiia bacterium]
MNLSSFLSYSEFIQLLLLVCFSISLSLVGSFLFLRKKAMIANAISHTVLFGIALLFICMKYFTDQDQFQLLSLDVSVYVLVSILTTFITIFLIEVLKKYARLNSDASTSLVFTTLFAIGAILVTLFTKSSHVGVDIIMGNLDLVHTDDLYTGFLVLALTVSFITLFFKDLVVLSFDPTLSHFSLKKDSVLQFIFLFLISLTITSGFRFVGIAPVLGLIIIPAVSASLYTKNVKDLLHATIYSNIAIGIIAVLLSKIFFVKFGFGLSTSGLLVTLHFAWFLFLQRKQIEAKA